MFYSAVFSCCGNKVPVCELNTYKEGLTGCGMSLFSLPRCGMEGNLKRDVGLQWGRGKREVDYFLGRMWELLIFSCGKRDARREFQCFIHTERFKKPTPVERSWFDGRWC